MPESIRTLLHDIGGDGPGPSRDLAAGALHRARSIGRRRFAAGAIGAVTALALAGAGTAGLINGRDAERTPPAGDPTTVEDSTTGESTENTIEQPTMELDAEGVDGDEEITTECGLRPQDWADRGFEFPAMDGSFTIRTLDEIPPNPIYLLADSADGPGSWRINDDGSAQSIDAGGEYEYHVAPDANRVIAVNRGDGCGAAYVEIGYDSANPNLSAFSVEPVHCPIRWSPDSDKVLFNEPVGFEDPKGYMLNVATGELTEVAQEVSCGGGVWLPDSEHVWAGGSVMRPDGSDAVPVPGLADGEVGGDEMWWPTGMSADRGEFCAQEYLEEEGDVKDPWKCDFYVDAETGEPLELPVSGDGDEHVVFLDDGQMLILVEDAGVKTQYLVDPDGNVVDERELPAQYQAQVIELVSYYPW